MSYLDELVKHIDEVGSTLNKGLVGERLRNMGQDYANSFNRIGRSTIDPLVRRNSSIDDLLNSSLSFGGVGAIRLPKDMLAILGFPAFGRKYVPFSEYLGVWK